MARLKQKEYSQLIPALIANHNAYWENCRPVMERYRDIYDVNFFREDNHGIHNDINIQVPDANSYIEGHIASLFSKAPAVRIGGDIKASSGNENITEAVVNRFLFDKQEVFTDASRLALIYPMSFIKVLSNDITDDVMDSITIIALKPWEILIDMSAASWDKQRWIGHISQITMSEAEDLFGAKDFKPELQKDYFTNTKTTGKVDSVPDDFKYITVVEFYDLVNKKRIFWSPNWKAGSEPLEVTDIPLALSNSRPLVPIVPLYLNTSPDQPLKGFSALKKIYDQVREKNMIRTQMARQIRRDSRQIVYKEGTFDEEALAKLEAGEDNSFVPVKSTANPDNAFGLVPTLPISNNYVNHLTLVEEDLRRSTVTGAFVRGEATKATATEVSAIMQYTAAEIGKMARIRDAAIETVALIYIKMLWVLLDDEDSREVLSVRGDMHVLRAKDLEGKFKITAVDQLSTPQAQATKQAQLVQLAPMLLSLGVPKSEILKQLGTVFDMDWLSDTVDKMAALEAAPPVISNDNEDLTGQ